MPKNGKKMLLSTSTAYTVAGTLMGLFHAEVPVMIIVASYLTVPVPVTGVSACKVIVAVDPAAMVPEVGLTKSQEALSEACQLVE